MFNWIPIVCLVLFLLPSADHPARPSSTVEIDAFLSAFVKSFDNLDWDGFRNSFSDDATVFYPRAFPERASGRSEYEKTFKIVFQQIRGNQTAAPFMDIQPRNLQVQVYGDTAVATFHLDDRPGFINRRTIVLHRSLTGWKIVHLHASEVRVSE